MHTTFLVFGLTGDLMKKKGIPALYALWQQKELPSDFRIVGLSRKIWTKERIKEHIDAALGKEVPSEFVELFSIYTGEGENLADVVNLKTEFELSSDKLFVYLCVSPELYAQIIDNLAQADLLAESSILIEKPFGRDLASARDLQTLLLHSVKEEQVYRIDHFLAKEAMKDLADLPTEEVASIAVYLNEAFGVEKRGAMYDPVGAFRDVGQNHLLEAAAAILGDRAVALERLHILTPEEIKTHTRRGQHEDYTDIEGVRAGSQTETYFRVESWFDIASKKIPLLLESGKLLPSRREVVVTLKSGEEVIPFESGSNEYERLFAEAFAGERGRFVGMREVEALWKFTDPIENEWQKGEPSLASYPPYIEPEL